MSDKKTIKVKLVRSVIGTCDSHRATVRGLGLRKLGSVLWLRPEPVTSADSIPSVVLAHGASCA